MAFLFQKFQKAVSALAKSSTFAKDPRQLQFEANVNKLFLYTSYNRLGENADKKDAEEIIELVGKASLSAETSPKTSILTSEPSPNQWIPRRSGLSLAVGGVATPSNQPVVPETQPLLRAELSKSLKNHMGYTLELKPSQISHKEAGRGLFIDGEAEVGSVIAFYPGVVYSPAYYRYIPGYPRVDAENPYLITRYDGTVINAQPWGEGADSRELWDGLTVPEFRPNLSQGAEKGSDRMWKMLSKPLEGGRREIEREILERHMTPNVMVCPYDFPLTEMEMRTYIPNILFGRDDEPVKMKRFGSFWFKSRSSTESTSDVPVLKCLVLVATRALRDEEVLLNYRLSNSKRRPAWYTPVDEEEDRRRWS
ncbi:hypothetical protein MKX01_018201 [Papaver californicum]|nr:hypothetical protein MKX01_018201 [Papaver californicum]